MDERLKVVIGRIASHIMADTLSQNVVVFDTLGSDTYEIEKLIAEHQTQPIIVIGHSQPTVEKSDVSHLLQEKLYELTRQIDYQTEFLSGREQRRERRKQNRKNNN